MIFASGRSAGEVIYNGPVLFGGHVRVVFEQPNGTPATGVIEIRTSVSFGAPEAFDAFTLERRTLPANYVERALAGQLDAEHADRFPSTSSQLIVYAGEVASGWLHPEGRAGEHLVWLDASGLVTEAPLPEKQEMVERNGGSSRVVVVTVPPRPADLAVRTPVNASMTITAVTNVSPLRLRLV